jgi:hypothetical protein
MEYISVRSSTVKAIGYDEASETLGVQFLDGREYRYFAVPKSRFDGLRTASSVGRYLNQFIKEANYRYKQVK